MGWVSSGSIPYGSWLLKSLLSHYWITLQYMLKCCFPVFVVVCLFVACLVPFTRLIWLSARKMFTALIFIINGNKQSKCTTQSRLAKCLTIVAILKQKQMLSD